MLYRLLAIAIILLAAPIGCKENTQPVEPSEVEVTEENLDAELDKMEQEINADAEAE